MMAGGCKQTDVGEHDDLRLQGAAAHGRRDAVHVDARGGRHAGGRPGAAPARDRRVQPQHRLLRRAAGQVLQVSTRPRTILFNRF